MPVPLAGKGQDAGGCGFGESLLVLVERRSAPASTVTGSGNLEESHGMGGTARRANFRSNPCQSRDARRRMHELAISLQALVAASIFFVWVACYGNIFAEFEQHGLPDLLRDLVGTFAHSEIRLRVWRRHGNLLVSQIRLNHPPWKLSASLCNSSWPSAS